MGTLVDSDFLFHLKKSFDGEGNLTGATDIYNYFPSIIYVMDIGNNKIRYINGKRFTQTLGYSSQDIKEAEDDIIQLIFKDDIDTVKLELEKFYKLADEKDHSFQCRFNLHEGEYRYFRSRGTVLTRDEKGEPRSVLFTAEDITEKIHSEQGIIALQSLVSDTEKLLDFGSWKWYPDSGKVEWSEGIYHLFDHEKKVTPPDTTFEFYLSHVKQTDLERVKETLSHAVLNKRDFEISYSIFTKHRVEKNVISKGKVVKDNFGKVVAVLGITSDISEQIKLNRDLVYYKEMMVEKEEFLNQGSWQWDVIKKEISWSEGMFGLFGYPMDTKLTRDLHDDLSRLIFTAEERARFTGDWNEHFIDKNNFIHETTIFIPDGSRKQVETYIKIIRNTDGEIVKIIGTSRDLTPIRKYERSLEEKINELNRSNKELEEFAYIASHDLQEPLRKLTTFSERLLAKFSDRLGQDGIVYLERIGAATENMRVLIENLLEFSRTARSNTMFTTEDLSSLLQQVTADLELKIEETATQVISQPLPTLEVIASQMRQLFDNLINNSIKFRKKGEPCIINITCSPLSRLTKDELHLPVDKNYYKIVIQDNGIGFENEYSERIFQIFQRLHGKSEYPGSGIGLAICKKIAENHNGMIYAYSNPDEGAVFTVILPEKQT